MERKIVQLTSGRGPAECNYALSNVYKKFLVVCENSNIHCQIIESEIDKEYHSFASVIMELEGENLDAFLKNWLGSILWISKSPYRPFHQRKNWFIGFFELELPNESQIDPKDIVYQSMRSSGNGGQNVNKVNSAVRATYKPSGLSVVSMDSRSQLQNKQIATTRLLLKLQDLADMKQKDRERERWNNQTAIARGNPVRIFRGEKFLE